MEQWLVEFSSGVVFVKKCSFTEIQEYVALMRSLYHNVKCFPVYPEILVNELV